MAKLLDLARTARVGQWIKNVAVFAPIVFSGFLYVEGAFARVVAAFIIFCLVSSSVYIFNDIIDIPKDREHPFKKHRPIASGRIPLYQAVFMFIFLIVMSLYLAVNLSGFFFLTTLAYFLINVGYTLWWKAVPIMDVLSIAAGFVLRVYAGSFVINVHMDVWFLLTVISLSLFLAVGKRRSEMTLLSGLGRDFEKHRKTLLHYTPDLLDSYTSMFANTTWLTYALFTFLHPPFEPQGRLLALYAELPRTLVTQKWLMMTVPFVIYGVMRYLLLIYEKNEGESPHRILMSDKPLLGSVLIWGLLVTVIIYGI